MERKAVVLLSGGLDSSTVLLIAKDQGFSPHALTFRYGLRHEFEIDAARRIAKKYGAEESGRFVNGVLDGFVKRRLDVR